MSRYPAKRTLVVMSLMLSSFGAGALATTGVEKVEAYLRHDYSVYLDGEKVSLKNPPLIYNGSSYLPVKNISELLDATVQWDNKTSSIHIKQNSAESSSNNGHSTSDSESTNIDVPEITLDEFALGEVIAYRLTYQDKDYPVLVNFYKDFMFLRVADLYPMDISLDDLPFYTEKNTKDQYVYVEQVKKRWKETPLTNLLNAPIIAGESDEEKIKTLNNFPSGHGKVLLAEKLNDDNHFKLLVRTSEGKYVGFMVVLTQNNTGGWYYSSMNNINYESK